MPCVTPAPSHKQVEIQRAARLLVWIHGQRAGVYSEGGRVDAVPPSWLAAADNHFGGDETIVPTLCALLEGMPDEERERLIYNARDRMSRALADWWEEHQEADRQRREAEDGTEARERAELARLKAKYGD